MIDTIRSVAIIGAGQMGTGIAQVFATRGYTVRIHDLSIHVMELSKLKMKKSLEKLYEKHQVTDFPETILSRVTYCDTMRELQDCNVYIESVFENFDVKSNILYKLNQYIDEHTYLATNTSSFSITSLAHMISHPDRFVGFHFMNPPPLMNLIEVIKGVHSSDETYNFFWTLANDLGKTPIYSRNTPGFVLNRILIPMINEAIYALSENVSTPEQIDNAMKLGANHPIGPLALADLIGLDTVLAILKTLQKECGNTKYCPSPLLEQYVMRGHLGRKTKKGFFEYD
ncbi:MAG: 3-hydroxybutyryl-CoA dehydrogenase [Alphaproteobacteria bacterium]|nr:3-hydroxybutyryl-CoA dehydrogenase [Alphaproteobacteria bacterium]